MKKIVMGILAHVDAGKTTLSESLLYKAGAVKKLGRVDHGNAFLDFDAQERRRGITIFSKQAFFSWLNTEITLIDTPGHVDFSAEMERTLQILDYAIIVISGLDGVQAHTETIWKLLQQYQIPTFIFVNKMDMIQADKERLYKDIKNRLSPNCIDFTSTTEELYENIALANETLLEQYLTTEKITTKGIQEAIVKREVFPCFFGSALKQQQIEPFLDALDTYTNSKSYSDSFGAKVYKITRDAQGNRLTHIKVTGGRLKAKQVIRDGEKVDQIRRYSGLKYELLEEAKAGTVCALKGLKAIQAGEVLGSEQQVVQPVLSSYMNYRVVLPPQCDAFAIVKELQQLLEEDPQLHISYQEQTKEIYMQVMGEVQIEILKQIIQERFDIAVTFDQGRVVYKETIADTVVGVGHYEPLRHYAEVQLLLRPGKRDSGLQFSTKCKEEVLARQYQRLILSHLEEKEHLGVLTGSPITDIEITLVSGKAHNKHTEGGDFREATYRAVRQGLKSTTSILLEPYFQFRLEVPTTTISKAIYDIEEMHGSFVISNEDGENTILEGKAPVARMQNYQATVLVYTKGKGRLHCSVSGYEPCHNQEEVIAQIGYDSEEDIENPTHSIFCSHGAGFVVKWDKVPEYMHLDSEWHKKHKEKTMTPISKPSITLDEEAELDYIFTKTYGATKNRLSSKETYQRNQSRMNQKQEPVIECLLVDGYNVIFAWESLKHIAAENLGAARDKLIDILSNYQGYKQCVLIIVFDAYKVKGSPGIVEKHNTVYTIYTREAQTADSYIERVTHGLTEKYKVVVATSDALEQMIVIGKGATRISSRELALEVERMNQEKLAEFKRKEKVAHHYPLEEIKDFNK